MNPLTAALVAVTLGPEVVVDNLTMTPIVSRLAPRASRLAPRLPRPRRGARSGVVEITEVSEQGSVRSAVHHRGPRPVLIVDGEELLGAKQNRIVNLTIPVAANSELTIPVSCVDVGGTVRAALARFERTGQPWCGSIDEFSAGNGSIMRLAPVPLFFAGKPDVAISRAADSSRTTHGAPEATDGCRYLAGLTVGALQGNSKADLLAPLFTPVASVWDREPLAPKIHNVAAGSFLRREPPEIRGSGYVVDSLEAALWAFAKSISFEHGALLAVNLGDDADTTGAVYGQLAGAYYGVNDIPERWRSKLAHLDTLEEFAVRLLRSSQGR